MENSGKGLSNGSYARPALANEELIWPHRSTLRRSRVTGNPEVMPPDWSRETRLWSLSGDSRIISEPKVAYLTLKDTRKGHSAPLTALAFVLIIEDVDRFRSGKQVASYVGLVPLEESSGNRRRLGHITKQGSSMLRFCWWKQHRSRCAACRSGAPGIST